MFTVFGILALLFVATSFVLSKMGLDNFVAKMSTRVRLIIGTVGIVFIMLPMMFFYAEPGTAYAIQYPWGGQRAVFSQGIYPKWFGRTIPIQLEIPIKYTNKKSKSEYIHTLRTEEWEFNDAVKASISTSVVISINTSDEEFFLRVADKNKSEANLVNARIQPNINQAIKNTCKLMSAQDYISGKASDFDRYFRDQLENGMYILEEKPITESTEVIGDSTTTRTIISGNNSERQMIYKIKYNKKTGEPYREDGNSMAAYGLTVTQAVVDKIDWEDSFDKRLHLQKEEVAQTQLEKQQAEREFYRTQKEIAKGEAEKAKERAKLEKEQIQKTIAAETEAKVAGFNLTKEVKQYEVEQFKAKSKKVAADAQAYENIKLVNAGLTPQERVEWEYKTAVGIAGKMAGPNGIKLPTTYVNGGGGNGSGGNDDMMMLILLEMMKGK
jgi:regulator of protease activity HflC (stomatin/prohibitin superfamily)